MPVRRSAISSCSKADTSSILATSWTPSWTLPDEFSFRTGVTTMVDVGSSGWRNFEDFRNRVIDRAATRVFAMLNIVGLGMLTDVPEQNVHDMDAKATAEMAVKHRDVVVGIILPPKK
jgi:predicted amidohydrolase